MMMKFCYMQFERFNFWLCLGLNKGKICVRNKREESLVQMTKLKLIESIPL